MDKLISTLMLALTAAGLAGAPALAQTAAAPAVSMDVQNIFNTMLFLIGGFLVMWMAAGFAMLEAGMVRSKNVSMQCLKNIALYSTAGIMFWVIGYNLMYMNVGGGFFGTPTPVSFPEAGKGVVDKAANYAAASDWFFQMVFCATTASIVSGTVAERIKIWPFLIFVVVLTGVLYPITGSWKWGKGWLEVRGFADFAGSTLVHSVGGWAALTGAIIIGARKGRYQSNGGVVPFPGSSIPLATLGTFILWLGWFGFNGGSQLALGTVANAADVARIFVNTNIAAASGVIVVLVLTQIIYKKVDVTIALNGALAGLVSITAEPLTPSLWVAAFVGGIGGVIVVFGVPMLDKLKIDDVVGAIPVHLVAGIWGTFIVPLSNKGASYGVQLLGIVSSGAFTIVTTAVLWYALKFTIGVRPTEEGEMAGMDHTEVGIEAYPEFGSGAPRVI